MLREREVLRRKVDTEKRGGAPLRQSHKSTTYPSVASDPSADNQSSVFGFVALELWL